MTKINMPWFDLGQDSQPPALAPFSGQKCPEKLALA
jgi:hypothetical protein